MKCSHSLSHARYAQRKGAHKLVFESHQMSDDQDLEERLRLMDIVIQAAEKLDLLERELDPQGSPPRHTDMAYQRLRAIKARSAD
jgi:hypothetical protein